MNDAARCAKIKKARWSRRSAGKEHAWGCDARATERTGHLGAITGFTLVRHSALIHNISLSARSSAPNGRLLGVLEKFAERECVRSV